MNDPKGDLEYLAEISSKLDKIILMLATSGKSQDEQIQALYQIGWTWKEIGTHVGLKPSTARMRVTNSKGKQNG